MISESQKKRYMLIAKYSFIVLAFAVILYSYISNPSQIGTAFNKVMSIVMPFIYGFILAYLLFPLVKLLENKVFCFIEKKKPHKTLVRVLSIIVAMLAAFAVVVALGWLIIPTLIDSMTLFSKNISSYYDIVKEKTSEFLASFNFDRNVMAAIDSYSDKLVTNVENFVAGLIPVLGNFTIGLFNGLKNVFIGLFICIYLLASKEKLCGDVKMLTYAVFNRKKAKNIVRVVKLTDKTFSSFIIGKLLDSLIIGIIFFIVFQIIGVPYTPLLSVLLGVTNVIPIFGPYLGGIFGGALLLFASPGHLIAFIIVVLIVQQFDGNILGPKILGDRTGLSAFWVLMSLILFGSLFGFFGMLIGVPLFSVIYMLVREYSVRSLKEKNLPLTSDVYDTDFEKKKLCGDEDENPPVNKK